MATPQNEIQMAVDSLVDRMVRLRLKAWGGPVANMKEALAYEYGNVLVDEMMNPQLHDAMGGRGWDVEYTGKGRKLHAFVSRLELKADLQADWFLAHVHPQDGSVASLADVRMSWYDYCQSRRVKLTAIKRDQITKLLDGAGFKRTRWTLDGVNVTGYKNVYVTYDPGVPSPRAAVRDEPATEAQVMTAIEALEGMASSTDLEQAYIELINAPTTLCRMCGRVTVRGTHRDCRRRNA